MESAKSKEYDVIVLGGGAAGMFCAANAGQMGLSVLVLESSEKVGKKILISGGGRCNFTNIGARPENFLSQNPHFCRSALSRYTPHDFLNLVQQHKIAWHEKKLGQLFCDGSSREIVAMLSQECTRGRVTTYTSTRVLSVTKSDRFNVETTRGSYEGKTLVVATGSLSIPKMGASGYGHELALAFGHSLTDLRPGLVPLTMDPGEVFSPSLAGISVDSLVSKGKATFRENILFTHRGLSGPAILQISSYWTEGQTVSINMLPHVDLDDVLDEGRGDGVHTVNALSRHLPKRLAEHVCYELQLSPDLGNMSKRQTEQIRRTLHSWDIRPSGTEGYEKAEVTLGGVNTLELSSKTMESSKCPGLYFIGEVVDVTGHLGGYNFQWAWASAMAAARTLGSKLHS